MKKIGIIIGKFFPLHIGHVNFIQRASGIVDRLYVVISYSDDADDLLTSNSRFVKEITPKDRLRFVKQTFKNQPNISSFLLDENHFSQQGENWEEWANTLKKEIEKREKLENETEIDWKNNVIFISNRDEDKEYNLLNTTSIPSRYVKIQVNTGIFCHVK